MKLTIAGKDYETPEFSAADFDDWHSEIELVNDASKDKTFMEVQAASIKVIVGFLQSVYPDLAERDIKKSISSASVIPMFGELLYGKKDRVTSQPS